MSPVSGSVCTNEKPAAYRRRPSGARTVPLSRIEYTFFFVFYFLFFAFYFVLRPCVRACHRTDGGGYSGLVYIYARARSYWKFDFFFQDETSMASVDSGRRWRRCVRTPGLGFVNSPPRRRRRPFVRIVQCMCVCVCARETQIRTKR